MDPGHQQALDAFIDSVEILRGPLSDDIAAASESCWRVVETQVKVERHGFSLFSDKPHTKAVQRVEFLEDNERLVLGRAVDAWNQTCVGPGLSTGLALAVSTCQLEHAIVGAGVLSSKNDPVQRVELLGTVLRLHTRAGSRAEAVPRAYLETLRLLAWRLAQAEPVLGPERLLPVLTRFPEACDGWASGLYRGKSVDDRLLGILDALPLSSSSLPSSLLERFIADLDWRRLPPAQAGRWVLTLVRLAPTSEDRPRAIGGVLSALCEAAARSSHEAVRASAWNGLAVVLLSWARNEQTSTLQSRLGTEQQQQSGVSIPDLIDLDGETNIDSELPNLVRFDVELVALAAEVFGGTAHGRPERTWQAALTQLDPFMLRRAALVVPGSAVLHLLLILATAVPGSGAGGTRSLDVALNTLAWAWITRALTDGGDRLSDSDKEEAALLVGLEVPPLTRETTATWTYLQLAIAVSGEANQDAINIAVRLAEEVPGPDVFALLSCLAFRTPRNLVATLRAAMRAACGRPGAALTLVQARGPRLVASLAAAIDSNEGAATTPEYASNVAFLSQAAYYRSGEDHRGSLMDDLVRERCTREEEHQSSSSCLTAAVSRLITLSQQGSPSNGWLAVLASRLQKGQPGGSANEDTLTTLLPSLRQAASRAGPGPLALALWIECSKWVLAFEKNRVPASPSVNDNESASEINNPAVTSTECLRELAILSHHFHARCPAVGPVLSSLAADLQASSSLASSSENVHSGTAQSNMKPNSVEWLQESIFGGEESTPGDENEENLPGDATKVDATKSGELDTADQQEARDASSASSDDYSRMVAQLAASDMAWQQNLAVARAETPTDNYSEEEEEEVAEDGNNESDFNHQGTALSGTPERGLLTVVPEDDDATLWSPDPAALHRLYERLEGWEKSLEEATVLLEYWSNRRGKQSMQSGAAGREGDVPEVLSSALSTLWEISNRAEESVLSLMAQLRATVAMRYRKVPGGTTSSTSGGGTEPEQQQPYEETKQFHEHFEGLQRQALDVVRLFPEDDELAECARKLLCIARCLFVVENKAELSMNKETKGIGGEYNHPTASTSSSDQTSFLLASELANVLVRQLAEGAIPPCAVPWISQTLEKALQASQGGLFSALDTAERSSLVATLASRYQSGSSPDDRDVTDLVGPILKALLNPGLLLDSNRLDDWETMLRAVLSVSPREDLVSQFDAGRWALMVLGGDEDDILQSTSQESSVLTNRLGRVLALTRLLLGAPLPAAHEAACAAIESTMSMFPDSSFCALLAVALDANGEARLRALSTLGGLPNELLDAATLAEAMWLLVTAAKEGNLAPSTLPSTLTNCLLQNRRIWEAHMMTEQEGVDSSGVGTRNGGETRTQLRFTARIGELDDESWRKKDKDNGVSESGRNMPVGKDEVDEPGSSASAGPSGSASGSVAVGSSNNTLAGPGEMRPGYFSIDGHRGLVVTNIEQQGGSSALASAHEELVAALCHAAVLQQDRGGELAALARIVLPDPVVQGGVYSPGWAASFAWEVFCQHLHRLIGVDEDESVRSFFSGSAGDEFMRRWSAFAWEDVDWARGSDCIDQQVALRHCNLKALMAALLIPRRQPVVEVLSRMNVENLGLPHGETSREQGADFALLALRASICLPEGEWPVWLVELLMPVGTSMSPNETQPSSILPVASSRTPLQALLASSDWSALADTLLLCQDDDAHSKNKSDPIPWLVLPIATGATSRDPGISGRILQAVRLLAGAAADAATLLAVQVSIQTVAPLMTFAFVSGRPWDSGHVGTSTSSSPAKPPSVMVPADIPLELLEGTEEGAALAAAAQMESHVAQGSSTTVVRDPPQAGSPMQSAFEVHATWRLTGRDTIEVIMPALLHAVLSVADELSTEHVELVGGLINNKPQLELAPTVDELFEVECAPSRRAVPGTFARTHSSSGSLSRDILDALFRPLQASAGRTVRVSGQGDGVLGAGKSGILPWETTSALFIADTRGMGAGIPEEDTLTLADLQTQISQRLADFIASGCQGKPALGAKLLSFSVASSVSSGPQLWEQLVRRLLDQEEQQLGVVYDSKDKLQDFVLEPLHAFPPDKLLGFLKECATASQPMVLTVTIDTLYKNTLALDKWVWQELVSEVIRAVIRFDPGSCPGNPLESITVWLSLLPWIGDSRWRRLPAGQHTLALQEWTENLGLRSLALQLSEPLEQHIAKQENGGSKPSVVDTTLRRLRANLGLGRSSSVHKRHLSEGSATGSLSRQSPSILDKFKAALHIDEGPVVGTRLPQTHLPSTEPAAESASTTPSELSPSKGQTRKKFVQNWNKGLSAIRDKMKLGGEAKDTLERSSVEASPAKSGSKPVENQRQGESAYVAEESLWIRVGLAAFATSAYIRSVLAPSLPSTPTAGGHYSTGELGGSSPRATTSPVHGHAKSLSMGSWRWDEQLLRELDTVMEARGELDSLEQLQQAPLLKAHSEEFHAFFSLIPELLSSGTGITTFQLRLQQLLVPQSPLLGILRAC